ncbi:hypothetical protein JOC85_004008 [Bacillus mesophilus]|nr:hypothetical protein [Bacillus mesophilus]
MIYTHSLDGITSDKLIGFFDGWPSPPDTNPFNTIKK